MKMENYQNGLILECRTNSVRQTSDNESISVDQTHTDRTWTEMIELNVKVMVAIGKIRGRTKMLSSVLEFIMSTGHEEQIKTQHPAPEDFGKDWSEGIIIYLIEGN